jgi:hypothetical protein
MSTWAEIERDVRQRAGDRCEYCRMHQALQGATFHIEHVIPRAKGGSSELDNLALACPSCNLHKADRVEVVDPESGDLVPLFHPRDDDWHAHFLWNEFFVSARSDTGRATLAAFNLNSATRIRIREAEFMFGLFPPEE